MCKIKEREVCKNKIDLFLHDIQSPILALKMWSKVSDSNNSRLDSSQLLCATVDRLVSITNDLKSLAAVDGEQNRTLAHKINDLVSEKQLEFESAIEIDHRPDPSAYVEYINADNLNLLLRCLSNAVNNSLEACLPGQKSVVRVMSKISKNQLLIRVNDNGLGLPPSKAAELFKKGHSLKKGNSGLGLYEAYSIIVEQWGGTLELTNKASIGTQLTITVPLDKLC